MNRIEKLALGVSLFALSSPALATPTYQVPAPAVGLGIGAMALIGLGYRALKRRINP